MKALFAVTAVLVAGALVLGAGGEAVGAPGEPRASKAPGDSQRQAARLVSQFRAAKKDARKRAAIVDEATATGPVCAAAVHDAVERELQPLIARYSTRFSQQAALLAKKKLGSVNVEEVAKLRRAVLGLQERMDFTPELITKEADPAMKRLEEMFVVDRAKVLEASEALQMERAQLEELGKLWERCAQYLYEQQSNDENKPKEAPTFEKYLQGEESLQAGLAAPMDAHNKQVLASNTRLAPKLDPEEFRAILALNLTRNLLGLNALAIDVNLCGAARDHSHDMQTLKFSGHESPVPGKKTPWDRAQRFGTTCVSENLCQGTRDGKQAIEAWFHSPGHHRSQVDKTFTRVGVGLSGTHFTELFGR